MFSAWYFCCCMGSSPAKTQIFLSILDVLENPESSRELRFITYEQLRRTEVWMQIYALPHVLAALRREDDPGGLRAPLHAYLADLVDLLPEEIMPAFDSLADSVESRADPRQVVRVLQDCAEHVRRLSGRELSLLPYHDLKQFLPETFLLTVTADYLIHDADFRVRLPNSLEDDASPLRAVLEAALNYQAGRLAFRLAALVAHMVLAEYSEDDVLALLWNFAECAAPYEPDLLQVTASILFSDVFTVTEPEKRIELAQEIIQETWTFTRLRRLEKIGRPPDRRVREALHRIGLEPPQSVKDALRVVYWQVTLWTLAAQVDEVAAAAELAPYWHPPRGGLPAHLNIESPFSKPVTAAWYAQMNALLNLQADRNVIVHMHQEQRQLSIPAWAGWLFFGPWIRLDPSTFSAPKPGLRYPHAEDAAALIRLTVSVFIAVRLLQRLPPQSPQRLDFARFLIHANDVLSTASGTQHHASHGKPRADELQLPAPLTGLVLAGFDQVKLAGEGRLESIPPELFSDVLRTRDDIHFVRRDAEPHVLRDEMRFVLDVVPAVLIDWITNSYNAALDEHSGPGRWLPLIAEVYQQYKAGAHHRFLDRLQAALVVRFLCREAFHLLELEPFDWRTAKVGKRQLHWNVPPRQMLLTEELPADAWFPEWDDTEMDSSRRLVRAIERLAAFKTPGNINGAQAERCRREWIDLLNGVNEHFLLDRFVRLRLLELLEDAVLEDWIEGQETVALALLEFGSVYELKQLFNIVYPINASGTLAPANHTRREVRAALLQAMYRDAMFVLGNHQHRVNAQLPREAQIELERAHLVENTLIWVAYSDQFGGDGETGIVLSEGLRRRCKEMWRERAHALSRALEAEVDLDARGKSIQIPADSPLHLNYWNVCGGVYDPNNAFMRLYLYDMDAECLTNLFEMDARNVRRRYLDDVFEETINVLGIVLSKREDGPDRFRYTFNIALTDFPEAFLTQKFNLGDFVCLPIRRAEKGSRRWQVDRRSYGTIGRVPYRLQPGDVKEVRVREYWRDRTGDRYLELKYGRGFRINLGDKEYDPGLWDADVSRTLRQFDKPADRIVYARIDEHGRWSPIDGTLLDLVLNAFSFDHGKLTILTLMGTAEGPLGEQGWRFSALPGENYVLFGRDFSAQAVEALATEIRDLNDPTGLIVCLQVAWDADGLRLDLAEAREERLSFGADYPDLALPFDRRHIAWREYFEQPEHCIARRDQATKQWFVQVDRNLAPGYPDRIAVEWQEYLPRRHEYEVEFSPLTWNERHGKVYGQLLYVNEARASGGDWRAFVQRWLNVRRGDIVRLSKLRGVRADGSVDAHTDENIRVRVEAESLTMLPVGPNDSILDEPRTAVIFHVAWRDTETAPELDPHQIPSGVTREDQCHGIFTLVPSRSEDKDSAPTRCMVAWEGGDSRPCPLYINNLSSVFVQLGSRITGRYGDGAWTFRIALLLVSARALWTVESWAAGQRAPQPNLHFLANVTYQGEDGLRAAAEARPGVLVLLSAPRYNVQHLAAGDGVDFETQGVKPHVTTRDMAQSNVSWTEDRIEYRRAKLELSRKEMLAGICRSSAPAQDLVLDEVWLRVHPVNDRVTLTREFKLSQLRKDSRGSKRPDDSARWEARLRTYLASPENVDAAFSGKTVRILDQNLRVPTDEAHAQWDSRVQILPDEHSHVRGASYPSDGLVRLVQDENRRVFASFRSVPPYRPNGFKQMVGGVFGSMISLRDNPLYYVGPEVPPTGSGEEGAIYHRFEWGYGKTLLVSEKNLRFNGGDFRNAQLTLFHGDWIIGVTFLPPESSTEQNGSEDGTEEQQCTIAIRDVALQFSQGTTLYFQRSKYQFVHALHLFVSAEQVRVQYVEGFDEKHLSRHRSFDRVNASLSPAAQARLLERFRDRLQSAKSELISYTVLGRLDDELFRSTDGREVVFDQVRYSFQPSDDGSPLKDNELVFAQAGEIKPLKNDMGLQIVPPVFLQEQEGEIGSDLREPVLMLRRYFSVRDELLKRFYEGKGPRALKNKSILVRLSPKPRNDGAFASMMRNIPNRLPSALVGEIEARELLLVAVLEANADKVRLELRPGVFVELQRPQLDACPDGLTRGAIVRVESRSNHRFSLTLAAFGDARYMPRDPRPVVVLPMNDMLKERLWDEQSIDSDRFWFENSRFTPGGLPGIVAELGHYEPGNPSLRGPRWKEGVRIMEQRHPKMGLLGRDANGQYRIAPAGDDLAVGRLHADADGMGVSYAPLGSGQGDPDYLPISWQFLTFSDDSIQAILSRVENQHWRYHDRYTGYWEQNGIVPEEIGDHTIWTGPLFFDADESRKRFRLRYPPESFTRFGFPVDELFSMLGGTPRQTAFTVAGPSDQGGLWIELVPGRLVELPAQLVVWQRLSGEKSLAELRWDAFSPGDKVVLSATGSTDIFAVSRVTLHNWQPGPRGAFGPHGCFLPIQGFDVEQGALLLGAGQYRLVLPMTAPAVSGSLALLYPDNRVDDPTSGVPQPGFGVLLEVDDAGRVSVAGMPHLNPVPNRDPDLWASDPLQEDIVRLGERNDLIANYSRLKRLIRVAGGALPVTVENVYDGRVLFFSRRFQQRDSALAPGELGLARVLGSLDERNALLHSGGLLKMRINQIVSGLPERFFDAAMALLEQIDIQFVLRGMPDGQVAVGFSSALNGELTVEPLEVVALGDGADTNVGLICRDMETQALYWLPGPQLAWVSLFPDQIRRLFITSRQRRRLKVAVKNREKGMPYVSVIDVAEARKESVSLVVGKELTVNLIEARPALEGDEGVQRYFVESASTKVILECEMYNGEILQGSIPVEVIRRVGGGQHLVSVVPLGKKRYTLDLPQWMTAELPPPGTRSEVLQRYLRRLSEDVPAISPDLNPRSLDDEVLKDLLCYAYSTLADNTLAAWQAGAAEEWANRNRGSAEINVAYTLIAILVLNAHGVRGKREFSRERINVARELVQNLGLRALRSCHVEILRQEWLGHADRRKRIDGLWGRLKQIEGSLRTPATAQNLRAIERFCRAMKVRRAEPALGLIADALLMTIGRPPSTADFFTRRQADVIEPLLNIYQLIPLTRSNLVIPLLPTEVNELTKLLELINAHDLESILLDPLPRIRRTGVGWTSA